MRICNQMKTEHGTLVIPMGNNKVWKYILLEIKKNINIHLICKLGHFS